MTLLTVYFCGTGSTKFDDHNAAYWQGELISTLAAQNQGREFAEWIVIDGPGSGDLQADDLWVKYNSYGYRGTLLGSGWDENVKHALNVMKGKFDWHRQKLTKIQYDTLKNAGVPIEDVKETGTWYSRVYNYGDRGVSQQQLQAQIVKIFRKNGPLPTAVNLVGWSRGGISCHMLANAMLNDLELKHIPVRILAVDPVPGPLNFTPDKVGLGENVTEYLGFYARDERSSGFDCVIPQVAKTTQIHIYPFPGRHATLVGSGADDGVSSGGATHKESGLLVRHFAEACLAKWGVRMNKTLNLSGGQILEYIEKIDEAIPRYEAMRDNVYTKKTEEAGGQRAVSHGAEGKGFSSMQGSAFDPPSGLAASWYEILSSLSRYDISTEYWQGVLPANVETELHTSLDIASGDRLSVVVKGEMALSKSSASFGQEGDANRNPQGPLIFPGAPAGSIIMGVGPVNKVSRSQERSVLRSIYDHVSNHDGHVYFYINERAGFYKDNSGSFSFLFARTRSAKVAAPTLLDGLKSKLGNNFGEITHGNFIKVYDTPRLWGQAFDRSVIADAVNNTREFEDAITHVLSDMRYRCDISTLNAPDAEWQKVLLTAIDTALTKKIGRGQDPQIRFLFAQSPTAILNGIPSYLEGTPNYLAFKKELGELVAKRAGQWERMPEIWVGRFYRIAEGLEYSLTKRLAPDDLVSAFETRMTWNHTKIIAVDGVISFVGGHNLNMDLFTSYPPVHDVSVKLLGAASLSSQVFLNGMWDTGPDLLTKERFDYPGNRWVRFDGLADRVKDPLASMVARDYAVAKNQALTTSGSPGAGFTEAKRVLAVGKYWVGPDARTDYLRGSEIMKEVLIKNAKTKICLSQQDLVSAWKKRWQDHDVCRWLLEALLCNPKLELEIVVSPLNAGAGAEGDQYSFGSGAKRTFELLKYYLTHDAFTDQILSDPYGVREAAVKRIQVAPFFYTDKVPNAACEEGVTYHWPDQSRESYTASLKEPSLAEVPPEQGIIGHPFLSLIKASRYFEPLVPSAPGNHAKVMIIDDALYVVGSDNLYPGYLSEFSYVVEGQEAVTDLVTSYWEPLWKYSRPHAYNFGNT